MPIFEESGNAWKDAEPSASKYAVIDGKLVEYAKDEDIDGLVLTKSGLDVDSVKPEVEKIYKNSGTKAVIGY